ncbi:uncharacterized protein LY89DRAFT_672255 [Mollisia scopiformis]|uniref:Uncharacterized protein n=1 Tax=Mollisia scopiformis TaxID=149040 RepID=A0A194X1B2_MOLSC|nr:uncharacterized protein LY89DRAFT_672255 [Mollisia scopiformis]KUJ13986.1 hypothetical protein LY89DRAFT_672255 [Mollisia scopiformis]
MAGRRSDTWRGIDPEPARRSSYNSSRGLQRDLQSPWRPLNQVLRAGEYISNEPAEDIPSEPAAQLNEIPRFQYGCIYWLKHRKEEGTSGCYEVSNVTGNRQDLEDQVFDRPVSLLDSNIVDGVRFYKAAMHTSFGRLSTDNWSLSQSKRSNLRNSFALREQRLENTNKTSEQTFYLGRGRVDRDSYIRVDKVLFLTETSLKIYHYNGGVTPDEPPRLCFQSFKRLMEVLRLPGNRAELYFGTGDRIREEDRAYSEERPTIGKSSRDLISYNEAVNRSIEGFPPRSRSETAQVSDPMDPSTYFTG